VTVLMLQVFDGLNVFEHLKPFFEILRVHFFVPPALCSRYVLIQRR
jgi:hypothetical protein